MEVELPEVCRHHLRTTAKFRMTKGIQHGEGHCVFRGLCSSYVPTKLSVHDVTSCWSDFEYL